MIFGGDDNRKTTLFRGHNSLRLFTKGLIFVVQFDAIATKTLINIPFSKGRLKTEAIRTGTLSLLNQLSLKNITSGTTEKDYLTQAGSPFRK